MSLSKSETVVFDAAWKHLLAAHRLDTVSGVYACTAGEAVTRSGSTEVRRVVLEAPESPTLYIKKYWISRRKQIWTGFARGVVLGRSKARREFKNLRQLRSWGLDAPAAIGWGEERRYGAVVRSFLISEAVTEGRSLDRLIPGWLPSQPPDFQRQWRRELISGLALYTRRLHERRFCHHDYFWRNIILNRTSLEHFWLIDSHKGKVWNRWTEKRSRAKDLATLDTTAPPYFRRPERLQFLLTYLGRDRLRPEDKAFARLILQTAEPLRAHELRRLRPQARNA